MIIRIARTFPRKKFNGIGLSAYYLQKFSNKKNIIFTKKIKSKIFKIRENNELIEIDYQDLKFGETYSLNLILILISKIYGEITFFFKIYFYLKKKNYLPTLIHLHSINYFFSAFLLKKIFNVPFYLNFSGTDFLRLKKLKILSLVINSADKIFNVSYKIHSFLLKNYTDSSKFIYTNNGIDTSIFNNLKLKKKKQFVAVGNLRWQKNYIKLLNAIKLFIKKTPGYKLLIIGDGEERKKLEAEITKLNLKKNVSLCGYMSHRKIAKIINESYLYLMSSVSEGMPKSLMEGIACGTPVITTNAGDCSIMAKNCGITLDKNCEPKEYADTMYKLVKNKFLWKKYRNNCLNKSQNYSWSKYAKKITKYYL